MIKKNKNNENWKKNLEQVINKNKAIKYIYIYI